MINIANKAPLRSANSGLAGSPFIENNNFSAKLAAFVSWYSLYTWQNNLECYKLITGKAKFQLYTPAICWQKSQAASDLKSILNQTNRQTSNIAGTRGQQDDPRLSKAFSNAICATQPTKNGVIATNAAMRIADQVTNKRMRGAIIFKPMVKKAENRYPLRPVIRPHLFDLYCKYGLWTRSVTCKNVASPM